MLNIKIDSKKFTTPNKDQIEVLSNIDLKLEENKFISIIGPSGCGKTTLLRIIAGFDDDFSGTITYNDEKLSRLGNVGYVPQEFSLFPWLTVEDNIKFALGIKNIPKEEQGTIILKLLKLVDMVDFRKFYPKDISGGMKQKIAICRAIATNPKSNLIVMDEPFSALDAQTRNTLQNDLLRIQREQNLTIIFVTHNIDEAVFLSNSVVVLDKNPATVLQVKEITLSHPRDRTSVEFNTLRKDLLRSL